MMAAAPSVRVGVYEILLDHDMWVACNGHAVPWLEHDIWRAAGLDPTLFPGGTVPMKLIEGDAHIIAAKGYALAHRAGKVEGPPTWLIQISIAPAELLQHLFDGSVQMIPHTNTLAFGKLVNNENYPGLSDVVARQVHLERGKQLLDTGNASIYKKRRYATD